MSVKKTEVDTILNVLGGKGLYQRVHHLLMALCAFSAVRYDIYWTNYSHECSAPPNGTGITIAGVVLSSSNYRVEYTDRKDASIVAEFDLGCERGALGDLPQTLLILGQGIGALILLFFSDRYGRKPNNIISHVGVMGISVGTTFSNSYITFDILRLLMGTVQQINWRILSNKIACGFMGLDPVLSGSLIHGAKSDTTQDGHGIQI